MSEQLGLQNYIPPGPVAAAFLADRSDLSAIMGPMGSGKTAACIMKTIDIASEAPISKITGERLFKWGVVRNAFTDLKRTTMKSIETWFNGKGHWGGGGSAMEPPFFKVGFRLADGTILRLWYEFIGLDEHNIEQLAKGWEVSGYWMNEADLMGRDVWEMVDARAGRYPGKNHAAPKWYGGILDYNAPDTENWLYKLFEDDDIDEYELFKQPGGLDPKAENVTNLAEGYYERLMRGKSDWWVRRNVHNKYGFSREGKPVYPEYNDDFHCAGRELMPDPELVVKVDFDQDLNCACVLRQAMPSGQMRYLDELFSDKGATGLTEELKRLKGGDKYRGVTVKGGLCDPAGERADGNSGESWIDCVNRLMGWTGADRVRAGATNDPETMQSAMRNRLKTNVNDAQPGILVSTTCRVMRKGLNSDYNFKKKRSSSGEYEDKPTKKHPVSDILNAAEFSATDDGGFENAVGRVKRNGFGGKQRVARVEVRL